MIRLPGNSSRTRTHATSVPISAPITATSTALPTVIHSALTATGLVTEVQNVPGPCANALTATAASGISTITLTYRVATPSPRPPRTDGRRAPADARRPPE